MISNLNADNLSDLLIELDSENMIKYNDKDKIYQCYDIFNNMHTNYYAGYFESLEDRKQYHIERISWRFYKNNYSHILSYAYDYNEWKIKTDSIKFENVPVNELSNLYERTKIRRESKSYVITTEYIHDILLLIF